MRSARITVIALLQYLVLGDCIHTYSIHIVQFSHECLQASMRPKISGRDKKLDLWDEFVLYFCRRKDVTYSLNRGLYSLSVFCSFRFMLFVNFNFLSVVGSDGSIVFI